ncbi:MAG: hydrogenase expression/formation protein HypE [Elusimicrobiota bacterium]
MKYKYIKKEHGYGGIETRELVEDVILPEISNEYADCLDDSAVLPFPGDTLIFTADSFVVSPPFFPGGDIGKLSVAGTVNDLVAQGGRPLYLSMAMILEEGFRIDELRRIAASAAEECRQAGVKIVCGDIKVVEKGKADGVYVTTSGTASKAFKTDRTSIKENDVIISTGTAGDHGAAVFQSRHGLLEDSQKIRSDCRSLTGLVDIICAQNIPVRFLRDATRGGIAGVMIELAADIKRTVILEEAKIPVNEWVKGLSYIAGLDYIYLACEGNMIIVVDKKDSVGLCKVLRGSGFPEASVIGRVGKAGSKGRAMMITASGGSRYLSASDVAQIPRIC